MSLEAASERARIVNRAGISVIDFVGQETSAGIVIPRRDPRASAARKGAPIRHETEPAL